MLCSFKVELLEWLLVLSLELAPPTNKSFGRHSKRSFQECKYTMKMQITLLLPLDSPEGYFQAGDTIEVEEQMYDWLMASYAELRAAEARKLAAAELEKNIKPRGKK
jgi:hypothetical protein